MSGISKDLRGKHKPIKRKAKNRPSALRQQEVAKRKKKARDKANGRAK